MRLVVGLGNPGPEYAHHRHNIGFMAVDAIVRRYPFSPWKKRFQGLSAEGTVAGERVLALKPETFMNLSGQSVGAALRFYKLIPDQTIVFHDELDLPPAKIRIKQGGGAGGHNGIRSLDEHIGKDYWRVRLGIGHPGVKELVSGYVLHDFAKAEYDWLNPALDALASEFPLMVQGQPDRYLTRVAQLVQPPNPKRPASPPPEGAAG